MIKLTDYFSRIIPVDAQKVDTDKRSIVPDFSAIRKTHALAVPENIQPAWYMASVIITGDMSGRAPMGLRIRYLDSVESAVRFPKVKPGWNHVIFHVRAGIKDIQLEIEGGTAALDKQSVRLRRLSRYEAAARRNIGLLTAILFDPARLYKLATRAGALLLRGRISELKQKTVEQWKFRHNKRPYSEWIYLHDTLTSDDWNSISARIDQLKYRPLISVVMPVYNVDEIWLRKAIQSVRNQIYPNWELCIADDNSTSSHIRPVLDEYAKIDPRIKISYRDRNGHISAATNSALALATGEFVAFLDHDDELAPHALYMVAEELNAHPEVDLMYSDEDKIDHQGNRHDPHFKTAWNRELFYSLNLITHLAVYRASIIRKIGGARLGYEGSQDYDLALRFIEHTSDHRIRHIPYVLYHWRSISGSTALNSAQKSYACTAASRAVQSHLNRMQIAATVVPGWGTFQRVVYDLPQTLPLVSIIICTRDKVGLLRTIVSGILNSTTYEPLEILIVDNNSQEAETKQYFNELKENPTVRILPYNHPFNFSAMNNFASSHAKGEVLAFLNNDLEVISRDWLREMVRHVSRKEVGAVGAMLYYENNTMQHAGVILGIGGVAGHAFKHFSRDSSGHMNRTKVTQELSAVTGACLLMRKEVFEEVGGFDEKDLTVAFNDIDLCLKVRKNGYKVIWTPYAELYHLESVSRGSDATPENEPRFKREVQTMRNRWAEVLDNDPYYNPNLTIDHENFGLAFPPRASKPWIVQPAAAQSRRP